MIKTFLVVAIIIGVILLIYKFISKMKKAGKISDLIISTLDIQSGKIKNKDGILDDKWILGYIFGMCSFPVRELQMGKSEFSTLLRLVLSHFYGEENLERQMVKSNSLLMNNDSDFIEGRELGYSEFGAFIVDSSPSNMPIGIMKRQL